ATSTSSCLLTWRSPWRSIGIDPIRALLLAGDAAEAGRHALFETRPDAVRSHAQGVEVPAESGRQLPPALDPGLALARVVTEDDLAALGGEDGQAAIEAGLLPLRVFVEQRLRRRHAEGLGAHPVKLRP